MSDTRNFVIAWASSLWTLMAAIETGTLITVISAIVLPIVFFAAGKTIDVLIQVHFRRRERNRQSETDNK